LDLCSMLEFDEAVCHANTDFLRNAKIISRIALPKRLTLILFERLGVNMRGLVI
jgi:hypothetical protein